MNENSGPVQRMQMVADRTGRSRGGHDDGAVH